MGRLQGALQQGGRAGPHFQVSVLTGGFPLAARAGRVAVGGMCEVAISHGLEHGDQADLPERGMAWIVSGTHLEQDR